MFRFTVRYEGAEAFLAAFDEEVSAGGLYIEGAAAPGATALGACTVEVVVAGERVAEFPARIGATSSAGVAVLLSDVPAALAGAADRLRAADSKPEEAPPPEAGDEEPRSMHERIAALNTTQKMQLALSGTRGERTTLLRDINKTLHLYVLRNPRIGLDEVQYAAKLASLSSDALKFIGEHPDWGQNPTVAAALVRNPHTPQALALRLLDRIPMNDLRLIAKGGARQQIVQAARRKLNV
jgi:hypothetical protein